MSGFAELHEELRQVARQLLGAAAGRVDAGDPVVLDRGTLADAGWLGLEIPEALGGAGATFAEAAVVAREIGRAGAVTPFLGSAVLGVGALLAAEPSPRRDGLLSALAAGDVSVAVALPTDAAAATWLGGPPSGALSVRREPARTGALADGDRTDAPMSPTRRHQVTNPAAAPFRLACGGSTLTVDGAAAFVPDAPDADVVLLLAGDPDGVPVLVAADPAGLDITATPVLDGRRFGTVTATDLAVADDDVLRFPGDAPAAVGHLLRRGALATAIDSVGAAEAMLDATVAYAKERRQFDRPIGSFQAVKHQLADALVQLTLTRELVAAAIADPADGRAVARAKAHATSIAVDVVGTAMQLHGGIGYTWESGIHAHLKRVALNRSIFGSPAAHRRLLAATVATA